MKLLSSDYDNTLNSINYDLKFNLIFLRKFMANGNLFLLNTGRPFKSIKGEIDKFDIPFDYLSCNDGNILFDANYRVIYSASLEENLHNSLLSLRHQFDVQVNVVRYLENILEFEIIVPCANEKFLLYLQKIMLQYKKYYGVNLHYKAFKKNGNDCLYLYSADYHKSRPIQVVSSLEGIKNSDIYAIGDNSNDYEMIRDYNGYVMSWAKPDVKEIADGKVLTVASLIRKINR